MRSRERNTTWPGTANSRSGVRRGFVVSAWRIAQSRRLFTSSRTCYFDRQHVDYVRYNFAMNFALFETRSGNVPVAVRRSTWRLRGARRVAFVLQIQDTTSLTGHSRRPCYPPRRGARCPPPRAGSAELLGQRAAGSEAAARSHSTAVQLRHVACGTRMWPNRVDHHDSVSSHHATESR